MKLLFGIKTLAATGGAERVFCTLCSELAQRGHEVIAVTFDQPGTQSFYPLNTRVDHVGLGVGETSRPARLSETLRRMIALRRVVNAAMPKIAVGFMHSTFIPLAFALAGTRIPVVGSEHIVREHYRSRPFQFSLFLAATPFLSRLTVLSSEIGARYPFVIRRRMCEMPNPIIPPSGRAHPGASKERYNLLSVGRLDIQKDHATLLRAFAKIANTHQDWDLKIFGEGPLRPELEQLVHDLDLVGRVELPGVIPDINTAYRAADAFVLPSRYEAFGLVTAEAMSYALPVVGFADCPGTNELILDDKTGLLVTAGADRAQSLASALNRLIADPELRQRLGNAGESFITDFSSEARVCDLWEGLFRELI